MSSTHIVDRILDQVARSGETIGPDAISTEIEAAQTLETIDALDVIADQTIDFY